jgi:hypothetical protein
MDSGYACAGWNEASVDESAGRYQKYVEDCQVCRNPNLLRIKWDAGTARFFIEPELE